MSATRDKTQKIGFVYSNLYQIYKKGTETAKSAPGTPSPSPLGLTRGKVLKAEALAARPNVVSVEPFRPAEFLTKRLEAVAASNAAAAQAAQAADAADLAAERSVYAKTPEVLRALHHPDSAAIGNLKKNLEKLTELHARLRFMLQELEELVKE